MVSIYPYQAAPGLEGVAERACRGEHQDEAHYRKPKSYTLPRKDDERRQIWWKCHDQYPG
jgi:hypothetical protein